MAKLCEPRIRAWLTFVWKFSCEWMLFLTFFPTKKKRLKANSLSCFLHLHFCASNAHTQTRCIHCAFFMLTRFLRVCVCVCVCVWVCVYRIWRCLSREQHLNFCMILFSSFTLHNISLNLYICLSFYYVLPFFVLAGYCHGRENLH